VSNPNELPIFESPVGAQCVIAGKTYDYFCGCGYLGFYNHPALAEAASEAARLYGMRLIGPVSGACHPPMAQLWRNATRYFETEDMVYFSSAYAGNGMLASALRDRCDVIFMDADAHHSVVDGAVLQQKPIFRYAYCDAEDLARQLKAHMGAGQRPLVMTDGIFPVSGAIPPLRDYWKALENYEGALLCVDDAHAVGVIGEKGQGSLEYFGLQGERRYSCGTMSKAFGAFGGIIAGTHELRKAIVANSTIFHGASDPPPPCAAAAAKSLEIVMAQPEIRRALAQNVSRLRKGLSAIGLPVDADSPSPIIPIGRKSGLDLERVLDRLREEKGIYLRYTAKYPSTPEGGAIRIAVFATHTTEQIERLVEAFRAC
jgi:8-amino-7-oxononanoate synthase